MIYSLAEIKNGTGFVTGQLFVTVEHTGDVATERDEAVADAAICLANQARLQARLDEAVGLLRRSLSAWSFISERPSHHSLADSAHEMRAFLARIDKAAR